MNLLAYILTFLLFVGPVVLAVIGWPVHGFVDKATNLFPSFYILIVVVSLFYVKGKLNDKKFKYAVLIIVITFVWYILNKLLGREANKNLLFQCMALPAMYYIFFELLKDSQVNRIKIRNIIIFMFTFNGLMAIYERLTLTLFYPYDLIGSEFDYALDDEMVFRSSALLGHPLTYAFLMFIVMAFVLVSNLNSKSKYLLYFIGFLGLFCANARAAIMISAGTFFLYVIRPLFQKGVSWSKRFSSFLLLLLFCAIILYLFNAGYGGRFEEQGDFSEDGSTLARIEVFGIISRFGVSNFLWGLPYKDVENMAIAVMGITHIENWFILSTMVVGLVITTIVTILFIPVYRHAIKSYDMFSAFLIFIAVIGLGSTNNSFATGIPALSVFFACSYAFSPIEYKNQLEENVIEESL